MATTRHRIRFAICLDAGPEGDLQVGRVYRVLPDVKSAGAGCLRVIDDSGEDYLYPEQRFALVELPEKARRTLLKAAL